MIIADLGDEGFEGQFVHLPLIMIYDNVRPKAFADNRLECSLIFVICHFYHLLIAALLMYFECAVFVHRHFYSYFDKMVVQNVSPQAFGHFSELTKESDKVPTPYKEAGDV